MNLDAMLPVTVIGGYLGSGKTTLVNHLLRHAGGRRLAVLVNEFGTLAIDEDLIEAADDTLVSLAGGCVCCSYGDDLIGALGRLRELDPVPEQVLLEASGVALPRAIAASLSLVRGLVVDAIAVLADAESIAERLADRYVGDTVARQLEGADLVLLGKGDLVDEGALAKAREAIAAVAGPVRVIETVHGALPGELLFGIDSTFEPSSWSSRVPPHAAFRSVSIASTEFVGAELVDADALAARLARDDRIVRAKGFVVDALGRVRTVQVVGRRGTVGDAPAAATAGLVVIGLADEDGLRDALGTAIAEAAT